MKPLDPDGLAASTRGRRLMLFLDFDGTLSPHRPDGDRSQPLPAAREALEELARTPHVRAFVITGRTIADVRRRLRVWGVSYAGNHGLYIEGPGGAFEHPLAEVASRAVGAAAGLLRERLKDKPGARLCQEGPTLSLNIGLMDEEGRRAAAKLVETTRPEMAWLRLRWQTGHLGWNLVPEVGWDKGDAVGHLLGRDTESLAIAIGDGVGDEPMFERVGEDGLSIRVGGSEPTKARYRARGPGEVARFLRALARAHAA